MNVSYWKRGLWLLALVLIQVLVLNHIHIGGYATPFAYVYFMLVLNRDVKRNVLLLLGFFVRPWLLTLFVPRDSVDDWEPGIRSMGFGSFLGYAAMAVFLHHAVLLLLDTFSFFSWTLLLLKVVCSTALTTFCVMMMESVRRK